MDLFKGIDIDALKYEKHGRKELEMVPGRVVQIDADFLAYMVAYDDSKPLADMYHNADEMISSIQRAAGAEKAVLHLTPSGSNKGGRGDVAMLKEYQGNRKGKPKPKYLPHVRAWMHKERGGIMHMDLEADDGMAIAQYQAIADGNRHLSVIATKDKDLLMVPGLLMDWDSGELTDTTDDFGFITLDRTKSQPKIKGRGHIMFFAQMLTGDGADNVAGLPKVHKACYLNGKPKACGPVMAYDILKPVKSSAEAFVLIKELYQLHGQAVGFKNYRTGEPIKASAALISEAQMLWMRRKESVNDVIDWLKEIA